MSWSCMIGNWTMQHLFLIPNWKSHNSQATFQLIATILVMLLIVMAKPQLDNGKCFYVCALQFNCILCGVQLVVSAWSLAKYWGMVHPSMLLKVSIDFTKMNVRYFCDAGAINSWIICDVTAMYCFGNIWKFSYYSFACYASQMQALICIAWVCPNAYCTHKNQECFMCGCVDTV